MIWLPTALAWSATALFITLWALERNEARSWEQYARRLMEEQQKASAKLAPAEPVAHNSASPEQERSIEENAA